MGEEASGLEVELIERGHPDVDEWGGRGIVSASGHTFYATVLSYEMRAGANTILKIFYEDGGCVLRDIRMSDFWVLSATDRPESGLPKGYLYDLTEESQWDAEDDIQSTLEETVPTPLTEAPEGDGVVSSVLGGPKRLEVEIRSQAGVSKKLVVIDIMEPNGVWHDYSLTGRELKGGELAKGQTVSYAPGWKIMRLDTVLASSMGSTCDTFTATTQDQTRAWKCLIKVWGAFSVSEKKVLQHWSPEKTSSQGDDYEDEYGEGWGSGVYGHNTGHCGQHWTNSMPNHYAAKKVEPAQYRVNGDEIGALLFRQQEDELEEALPLLEILERMEKKDEAEDAEEFSADSSTGVTEGGGASEQRGETSANGHCILCNCGPGETCKHCENYNITAVRFGHLHPTNTRTDH